MSFPVSNNPKTAPVASKSTPVSNNPSQQTAPVLKKEGLPNKAETESEGLPKVIHSGIDLAPMDAICKKVNENLQDCRWCKGTSLVLELDRCVGLASNWKLSCKSCNKEEKGLENKIAYLKRTLNECKDYKERRSVKRKIYQQEE